MSALTAAAARPHLFILPERDLIAELLRDKRSPNTRKAYQRDLKDFFQTIAQTEPSPQLVAEFLQLERATALQLVLSYKAALIEKNLSEATVNRRLAAIRSLVNFAQAAGKCPWGLDEIHGEKIKAYRDTSGVGIDSYKAILAVPNRATIKGRRDYAILRLLWDNALRRGELHKCNVVDLNPEAGTLSILGKGRGTQREIISLSPATVEALMDWLSSRHDATPDAPLFTALDHAHSGHRLTGSAIYDVVRKLAQSAGISKIISPHRCRHSSITAALDATNGNVREVKKLSRHAKTDTLLIYDDNRLNAQQKVSNLLSGLIE